MCLLAPHNALAQHKQYAFKHYTTENGLLSNAVSAFYQDKQGYLWIGGMNGLQRFDGYRFINYFAELHNPNALQSNYISSIFEDSKNRLWVGTSRDGAYCLNRNNNTFYNYNTHAAGASNKVKNVICFAEDANNDIWLSCVKGFYKLNAQTNQFENYSITLEFDVKDLASTVTADNTGNLWFCGTKSFKHYNVKTKLLTDKSCNPLHLKIFDINEAPARINFDVNNNIWFATPQNKIYKFDVANNALKQYSYRDILTQNGLPNLVNYSFDYAVNLLGSKKNIIVGLAEKGLLLYDANKDQFNFIPCNENDYFGLHNFSGEVDVSGVLTDNDGLIWVYGGNGLEYFNPKKENFQTIKRGLNLSVNNFLPQREVSYILQSKFSKDIYVSYYDYKTSSGIYRLDSNFNIKKHYILDATKESGKNQLWCLFEDDEGNIWSPTQDKNLLKIIGKTDQLVEVNDTALLGNINTIKRDKNGDMWLAYWNKGIKKIDHITKQVSTYSNQPKGFASAVKRVFDICFDSDDILWLATDFCGLVCFNKRTNQFVKSYTYDEKNTHSISSNLVKNVYVYNADTLLLATSEGLNIFDKRTEIFTAITSKQGLTSNFVESLFFDDDKNIWVCCANGICKVNPRNWKVTNYGAQDGIIERSITGRVAKLDNGSFLVGTALGFMMFHPKEINDNKIPSNVFITGLNVFGERRQVDSLLSIHQPIHLKFSENTVGIDFAALDYSYQNKITYYYQLEGIDKDWVATTTDAAAHYGNLSNGKYLFKVKCVSNNGIACKDITTITIIIEPPLYKIWWFYLLEGIAVTIGIIICYKLRKRHIERSRIIEQEKEKADKLQTEQLKNQLEMEKVINYFSSSMIDKHNTDAVLWDVVKNLIGKLGFVDCMIYLWNGDKTKLIQKAGFGEKGSIEEIEKQYFDVALGQGIVGYVAQHKTPVIVDDTSKDERYRIDEMARLSELCVPIIYSDELIGVIDTEHPQKAFFTQRHLQLLTTIATLVANKLNALNAEENLTKQIAEVKMQALRSQMNPHFIFNSLNSINHFILLNDTENASNYLTKFSRLIRLILDSSRTEWSILETEIKALELYIELEMVRFDNAFDYGIIIDDELNPATVMIPPLIIQPYVENAIWHGLLLKQDGKGKLQIKIWCDDDLLKISIEDNGVGRKKATQIKSSKTLLHKSHGMKITAERLDIVNNVYAVDATVVIEDLTDNTQNASGTRVLITMKKNTYASNYSG